jgi:thiamine phosphate synthase YjbQ (UPF0047 family)
MRAAGHTAVFAIQSPGVAPFEVALDISPRARLDVIDVRAKAAELHHSALASFSRCFYASRHTTAGYLPQSLCVRLAARPDGIGRYLDLFRVVFPESAGYRHDQLDLRHELDEAQRRVEPTNADSHLTFIGGGLHACVSYNARRPGPAYFIDLDGTHEGTPRKRTTTIVGYNHESVVARITLDIPVSPHPIDAINLKNPQFGLYDQVAELLSRHGVEKGRVRFELGAGEQAASLTVNEYETLLMQHDLADVLRNPLRFAAEKARHAWNDPRAVPAKAIGYAKYDLVRAMNRLVDVMGLGASWIERTLARTLEVPASRFLRMRRSVDLLVSDSGTPGKGRVVEGTYQAPILIQWRPAPHARRQVNVAISRFQ